MKDNSIYYKANLSNKDFKKISEFVHSNFGIKLPYTKKAMVQNRLYKRLIYNKIPNFSEYVEFVFSESGNKELVAMIDEITTNKTDFFREKRHFDFLNNEILPKVSKVKIWSAGCSTGEEAYSLAMCCDDNHIEYKITATDISTNALQKAKNGIYTNRQVKDIPNHLISKYFEKIRNEKNNEYHVKDIIKNNIKFFRLNFLEKTYKLPYDFDIIFFKNVLIYFDFETQNKVLDKIVNRLKRNGFLFIGLAETINNKELPIEYVTPSIYKKI